MVFGKEFGNLAQGDTSTGKVGTSIILVMETNSIVNIPVDRTITYTTIVVDYHY